MRTALAPELDRHARSTIELLDLVLSDLHPFDFCVRLWDGSTLGPDPGMGTRFTLVLRNPSVVKRILLNPGTLTVGEAYLTDDIDVEGDVESLIAVADRALLRRRDLRTAVNALQRVARLPSSGTSRLDRAAEMHGTTHSLRRDRTAVSYHYDVSNDFYRLFLDQRMVYSCAYFQDAGDDLDTAQEQKLDLICRKLRLREGDRLLDVGCGWGGLMMHAASRYGADALGVTLSDPQARLANERFSRAGLADRCRAEVRDYREVTDWGCYDKIVSVGMFEHVGAAKLGDYFDRAFRLLRPGGLFMNHGIANSPVRQSAGRVPTETGPTFWQRYVFPDGELVPIHTTLAAAETAGFDVRDVESLREHYALTLRHWVSNLERQRDAACDASDELTYRIWRLYMSACAYGFSAGFTTVYQTLLARADDGRSGVPLTRHDCYDGLVPAPNILHPG